MISRPIAKRILILLTALALAFLAYLMVKLLIPIYEREKTEFTIETSLVNYLASPDADLSKDEPYMIVIGDSLAEGRPGLVGQLDRSVNGNYNPKHLSLPGQLSYELSRPLGLRIINQAVGGQTSSGIRLRWPRDALGQTVGDLKTVPNHAGQPKVIFLHVGINDIANGDDLEKIKGNFRYFAQSAKERRIWLVVANIGVDAAPSWFNPEKQAIAKQFNVWLAQSLKPEYDNLFLIDYLNWSSAGTNDFLHQRPGIFSDDVHLTKSGYRQYAHYIVEQLKQAKAPFLN